MNRQQMILALVKFLLYSISRWLIGFLQEAWWLLNGTSYQIWRNSKEEVLTGSSVSAQVLNIHWRYRYSEIIRPSSLTDFVYSHSHFDHPSVVLQNEVTLYSICDTKAVFVEAESGVDVANSNVSSFMKIAQFQHARRLIVVPIWVFHRLAEEAGGPHGRIFLVSNSGRCGSTLLCRIFEETQRWTALAEPDVLNTLSNMDASGPHFDRMVRNTLRMLCKPRKGGQDGYLIKISAPATLNLLRPLYRIFPLAHYAYMYRDGVKVAQSMTKMREEDPLLKLLDTVLGFFPRLQNYAIKAGGFESPAFVSVPSVDSLPRYFLIWAILSSKFVEFRESGIPIVGIRYEDLVANPMHATHAVLQYAYSKRVNCHVERRRLERGLLRRGLVAFMTDSHKSSILRQDRLNRHKPDDVTPQTWSQMRRICQLLNLPPLEKTPCLLPDTITGLDQTQLDQILSD